MGDRKEVFVNSVGVASLKVARRERVSRSEKMAEMSVWVFVFLSFSFSGRKSQMCVHSDITQGPFATVNAQKSEKISVRKDRKKCLIK